ncbi:hypothetical protein ACFYV7_39010 [Nocardia suismassiliense]|uniref:Uncharacterized protein n=1 Tax=Nocardia suismassiliense TaxID=2077092 RepID=A0ABW6R5N7_9NOCA
MGQLAGMVAFGPVGIAVGWLLVTSTTTEPVQMVFMFGPIVMGALSLILGLHHFISPVPDVAVDERGVTLGPFGQIPWAGISCIHLVTAHTMRYLVIELVEPKPNIVEQRWPRWVYGLIGKFSIGYPLSISERWLRPISLDDIAAELHRRNPGLVVARSEQNSFCWW